MLTYRSMLRFSHPRDASYLARSDTPLRRTVRNSFFTVRCCGCWRNAAPRRVVRFLLFAEDAVVFGHGVPARGVSDFSLLGIGNGHRKYV